MISNPGEFKNFNLNEHINNSCKIENNQSKENSCVNYSNDFKSNHKEVNLSQKLELAKSLKDEGNKLFSEKKYDSAFLKYKEGLEQLYGEGLSEEARNLMLSLNLNLCNCLNNLGMYDQTIERTQFSLKLKTDNPKVYYYRANALIKLKKFEEAELDYNKLVDLLPPNDPGVLNIRKIIDENIRPSSHPVFKSILKSGVYHDREKEVIIKKHSDSDDEY
jgi:tetratricopeptide (TPR) repeat protein